MFAELPSVVQGREGKRREEGGRRGRRERREERRGGERMGWARLTDSGTLEEAAGMR